LISWAGLSRPVRAGAREGGTPDGVLFGRLTARTRRALAKGPIMGTQPRLSDSEREERRERDRERLKQAAEQLLTSEGWQRWVRVRAQGGLARLSLNNQLLVALSCPEATFVAGFRAWLKLGYCVRKGEKAIRIVAPMPIKPRDTETADADDEKRVLFKGVSVFDRSQVASIDGMPQAPLEPPSKPLTGDSHAHLLEPTRAFVQSLGSLSRSSRSRARPAAGANRRHAGSSSTQTSPLTRNCGSSFTRRFTASVSGMASMAGREPR
jgi:N-terminal domain of anti-restriction factor ArdC